jgi:hypothetical protein
MNDNATLTGIVGTTTSFTGFMVSLMPHIEGTYAVKRNEADFSKIKYKPQEE